MMSYVDDKIDRKQFIIQYITPNQYDAKVCHNYISLREHLLSIIVLEQ